MQSHSSSRISNESFANFCYLFHANSTNKNINFPASTKVWSKRFSKIAEFQNYFTLNTYDSVLNLFSISSLVYL